MVHYIEDVLEEAKRARAEPLSETHDKFMKILKTVKAFISNRLLMHWLIASDP